MSTAVSFLRGERDWILTSAGDALERLHVRHYEAAGVEVIRERLKVLFDELVSAIETRNLGPMQAYAQGVAEERFSAGYDLSEVQTAFNALEEATWTRVLDCLHPSEFAEVLGLVTTVLGTGKDELARAYVTLASDVHAPSLDLRSLFAGTA